MEKRNQSHRARTRFSGISQLMLDIQGSKMQRVSLSRKEDMLKVANRLSGFFVPKNGFNKKVIYRAITHHYQTVFEGASPEDKKVALSRHCEWPYYRTVSRTKIRHRINYLRYRFL